MSSMEREPIIHLQERITIIFLGNMVIYPEFSLAFWNKIKTSDGTDLARIHMQVQNNWVLNSKAEPTLGSYTEEVRQIEDALIKIGELLFTDAEDEELEFAEKVIDLFDKEGRAID